MAPSAVGKSDGTGKKRKASTAPKQVESILPVASDGEDYDFEAGELDGALSDGEGISQDEDEVDSGLDGDEDDEDDLSDDGASFSDQESDGLGSEEIPSEEDSDADGGLTLRSKKDPSSGTVPPTSTKASLQGPEQDERSTPDSPRFTTTTSANGGVRRIYPDIVPVYDSDDSDAPPRTLRNTIGNIPLSFYDNYPHIGYDINGHRVQRPAKGEALDALLDSIDLPKGWTGLTDPETGKPLELSQQEMEVLKGIMGDEAIGEDGVPFDMYPPTVEYFTSKTETMPLSAAPEPKRRFVPSKHEAKRVMKIVRAIRAGHIQPYKPPEERADQEEDENTTIARYDVWADEVPRPDHPMNVPAPKLPPPGYEQSYNPPPEYLPSKAERKAYEDADESDREQEYLPTKHDALRKVPGYEKFVKERFERSLDLYLAPRVRRSKLNIDPESLLPKLPSPEELRPFPTTCATLFRGHEGRVRSLSIDPAGIWLASGGDDGTVRVWEILTGRQIWSVRLDREAPVSAVRWRPGRDAVILAAAAAESVYLMVPPVGDPEIETASIETLDAGWGYAANNPTSATTTADGVKKAPPGAWTRPSTNLLESSVLVKVTVRSNVKVISWHRRGDYFATTSPAGQSQAVAIHTLSKHLTQLPFRRVRGGAAQAAHFHPSRPILFVATEHSIRSYDLVAQQLLKIIQPGAKLISGFDIHSGGDNLIVGSNDRRLLWHDLELSTRPYKTLRYHNKAIRAVRYHPGGLPLFADASDDGTVQVFHGKVVNDMMENATIVPLKVLKGHKITAQLGVLDLDWHPREPWCVSAGADGTCRLWT
ncbi:MAG: Ribosome biogenesis protein erb1 [Chaenotheca gracillima]|nr:MAG: Ribosome biogenesis protein erb1 [Chaenotheca gracillima]